MSEAPPQSLLEEDEAPATVSSLFLVLMHFPCVEAISPGCSSLPSLAAWVWFLILTFCLVVGTVSAPSAMERNSKRSKKRKGKKENRKRRSEQPRRTAFQYQLSRSYYVLWRSSFLKEVDFHLSIRFAKALMKTVPSAKQIQELIAALKAKLPCKDAQSENDDSRNDGDDQKGKKKKKEQNGIKEDATQESSRNKKNQKTKKVTDNKQKRQTKAERSSESSTSKESSTEDDDDDKPDGTVRAKIPKQKIERKKKAAPAKVVVQQTKEKRKEEKTTDEEVAATSDGEDEEKETKSTNPAGTAIQKNVTSKTENQKCTDSSRNYPSGAFFCIRDVKLRKMSHSHLKKTAVGQIAIVATKTLNERKYKQLTVDREKGRFGGIVFIQKKGVMPAYVNEKLYKSCREWSVASSINLGEIGSLVDEPSGIVKYLKTLRNAKDEPYTFFLLNPNKETEEEATTTGTMSEGCCMQQHILLQLIQEIEIANGIKFY